MRDARDNYVQQAHPDVGGDPESGGPLVWVDTDGRTWRVHRRTDALVLTSDDGSVELPASEWERDVYAAPHGGAYIIRIETFEQAIGFLVPADRAEPVLRHIGRMSRSGPEAAPEPEPGPDRDEPLLWPKVSPLAVWALITSSLAFVPILGVIPAAVTVVLLLLHRARVRRSRAYAHSRALCRAAFLFLTLGLMVSGLATPTLLRNLTILRAVPGSPPVFERSPVRGAGYRWNEPAVPSAASAAERELPVRGHVKAAVWEEEHNWGLIAVALLVVLLSLTVHEAAHATTAWWLGDDFARSLGRVTLNPMAHIDPIGTVILPLVLFLSGWGVFGWARPVPVRLEHIVRRGRAHILVSIAGPGSNLLLAAASLMLLIGLGNGIAMAAPGASFRNLTSFDFSSVVTASGFAGASTMAFVFTLLKLSFVVNVFLAFFNLIPIPPLDGSWVLEHLFPGSLGRLYARLRPYSLLLFFGLIYTDVLLYLLKPGIEALRLGLDLLSLATPF